MFIKSNSIRVKLDRIEDVGARIKIFHFVAEDSGVLPLATPGAHIDVEILPGVIRQYSLIAIDPHAFQYSIAVLKQPNGRGGSVTFHAQARAGSLYSISAPRNHFPLSDEPGETVLFGGGIGVTPLLPMFRALKAREQNVKLYYWVRSQDEFLCQDELADDPDVQLFITSEGAVPRLSDLLPSISSAARLYCCGPEAMLNAFADSAKGRRETLLHVEHFAPVPQNSNCSNAPFTIMLQRQGLMLEVPADKSILEVCLDAGIDVPYSCEEGICGACQIKVLDGTVDHRDSVWPAATHDEDGSMIVCCSRAAGKSLVLDI